MSGSAVDSAAAEPPVRIARVITRLNVGGPARHVAILSSRLGPDFESLLFVGTPDGREGSLLDAAVGAGATVVRVPGLRRRPSPLQDLRAAWWLYRRFRRLRPTIVATHTAKAGALGRLAAVLAGVPIRVHTFHGHVLQSYFGPLATALARAAERVLDRFTTHVIAVSPEIASDLHRMGIGRGKTTVVPLGLDLEGADGGRPGRLRPALGIGPRAPLVGIVGRLVPIKNHELFLQAARHVLRAQPGAHFAVVGDGELRPRLEALTDAFGLGDRVRFTGWRHDLPDVYRDLDVVVCCSLNEGTPVSVIEASAAGRPVVATDVGGMRSVVRDGVTGLLVPSGDERGLAEAVGRLLADPDLAGRMGRAGRDLALSRHGSGQMVGQLRAVYLALAGDVRPAGAGA